MKKSSIHIFALCALAPCTALPLLSAEADPQRIVATVPPFSAKPLQLEIPRPPLPPIDFGIPTPALLAPAASNPLVRSAKPKFVTVVSFENRPEVVGESGRRAANLLHDHQIEFLFADGNSAAVLLSVPADRAAEALRLLAAAIQAEHLRLQLIEMSPTGEWGAVVSPESILQRQR